MQINKYRVSGGYLLTKTSQLAYVCHLKKQKLIKPMDLPIFWGMVELIKVREMTARKLGKNLPFCLSQLLTITDFKGSDESLQYSFNRLIKQKLIRRYNRGYVLNDVPKEIFDNQDFQKLYKALCNSKEWNVLLPRRVVKYLARLSSRKAAEFDLITYAYVNCIYSSKHGGIRDTTDSFTMKEVMSFSSSKESALRAAKAKYEELGMFKTKTFGIGGWKRTHYTINLEWVHLDLNTRNNAKNEDKKLSTSSESGGSSLESGGIKNHYLLLSEKGNHNPKHGFLRSREELSPPTIFDIQREDLVFDDRLEALFLDYVAHSYFEDTPRPREIFFAHANKALRIGRDPSKLMGFYVSQKGNRFKRELCMGCDVDFDAARRKRHAMQRRKDQISGKVEGEQDGRSIMGTLFSRMKSDCGNSAQIKRNEKARQAQNNKYQDKESKYR